MAICWPARTKPFTSKARRRGFAASILPFGQSVQLKTAALVPQPHVGVHHLAHAAGSRIRRCFAHGFFDCGHDFGRMGGCTLPLGAQYTALSV